MSVPRAVPAADRILNDVGLAVWFAASVRPRGGGEGGVPARSLAMALHMLGAAYVTADNRGRLAGQRGVLPVAAAKALLSLAAAVATVAADRRAGRRGGAAAGGASPAGPGRAAAVLTGATLVANAVLGEQQRPREVLRGMRARVLPS